MEQLSFFGIEKKIEKAVTMLKMFEAKALEMNPEGYYLCFSGGKDSQVIYALAKKANVKFQAYYNVTTVDPPEIVYFIRKAYPDVIINRPETTMWELIKQKHYPPTRRMRYCCSELKERGGKGCFVITGVRWAESRNRKKRGFAEVQGQSEAKVVLNNDNDEKRRQIESCQIKGKRVLNPILDWTDDEVWQFIHTDIRTYCSLYDEGFTRIGCIGCPLASIKQREKELARYPMFKRAYLKAFDRMLSYHKEGRHGSATWKDAEDVYRWWLYGNPKKEIQVTGQIEFSIKRELVNTVEEVEKKKPEPSKEWENFFQKKLYDWKKVYQFGTEENQTTDGEVLNQIRKELVQIYENYFSDTNACDRYKKKIPQVVKEDYMAGEAEILETARRLVKKYMQSLQFQYVLVKRPQIREMDRKKFQVDLLVGRIQKLEICVKKKDVLGMRIFSKEDELDKMLAKVYQKIKKLPRTNNGVEDTVNKRKSSSKNQITLEEFIS